MNLLRYLSNYQQQMGTKYQRAVYEWVNISDDLVQEWFHFFKGQAYEWGRFRNTQAGSHTRTITVLKFLTSPPPSRVLNPEQNGKQCIS